MKKINTIIIGASGYTGVELIRILLGHKMVEIKALVAHSNAGQEIADIYPHLRGYGLPGLVTLAEVEFDNIDVVFCCLPHATSQEVIKNLPQSVRVVDLSADFRLNDTQIYEKWYGGEHKAPDLQKEAVYGLSEHNRDKIVDARIVACPGCYPTSALLPLMPLIQNNLISSENIIIDSKSGVTGAGRALKQNILFSEINEGVKAYGVCSHRHIPEIEQSLSEVAGSDVIVNFTPQLVPTSRGILSTIYVDLKDGVSPDDLRSHLVKAYRGETFVNILDVGLYPSTKDVYNTNNCMISVSVARTSGKAVIVSVIDNLTKGSSGQAVQNMNIMFGLDEKQGLDFVPVFP